MGRAGEPEPVGAACFWLLWAGAGWKKTRSRSQSRLEKKSGAEAETAWKKSKEPEPLKNIAGSSALREDKERKEIVL